MAQQELAAKIELDKKEQAQKKTKETQTQKEAQEKNACAALVKAATFKKIMVCLVVNRINILEGTNMKKIIACVISLACASSFGMDSKKEAQATVILGQVECAELACEKQAADLCNAFDEYAMIARFISLKIGAEQQISNVAVAQLKQKFDAIESIFKKCVSCLDPETRTTIFTGLVDGRTVLDKLQK